MRRSLAIAAACSLLFVAGCGTSGGDQASDSKGGDAGATTTAAEAPAKAVTTDQLEALFPKPSEIGPGYGKPEITHGSNSSNSDINDDGADGMDAAMKEQCPKAAELDFLNDSEPNKDEVSAKYKTKKDQEIEISLDPTPGPVNEDNLDQVIEAWNDCGTVTLTDPSTGEMKMELAAERLDGVGDYGAKISLNATFELFGMPIGIDFTGYLFNVNGVLVGVTAAGGLDDSMEAVKGETQLLEPVSKLMQERVESITD